MNRWQQQSELAKIRNIEMEKQIRREAERADKWAKIREMPLKKKAHCSAGMRLSEFREKAGYKTQEEAAAAFREKFDPKFTQDKISRLENGKLKLDPYTIKQFAELYGGFSADDLLDMPNLSPKSQQRKGAVSYTGLSRSSIDFIESLKADQKEMLDKILTCTDESGGSIFEKMLSEMVKADHQQDEMEKAEADFQVLEEELTYFDYVCRNFETVYKNLPMAAGDLKDLEFKRYMRVEAMDRLDRACDMIRPLYLRLFIQSLDQKEQIENSIILFRSLISQSIPSAQSEITGKGRNFADAMVSITKSGENMIRRAQMKSDYDAITTIDEQGTYHFSFPKDRFFKDNPEAIKEFEEKALSQEKEKALSQERPLPINPREEQMKSMAERTGQEIERYYNDQKKQSAQ